MLFWLICAAMTAAALYAVTRPLTVHTSAADVPDAAADVSVYRDQLKEIEADRARALIGEAEAEAARIEVSRRLLARMETAEPVKAGSPQLSRRVGWVFMAAVSMVPLLTLAFYLPYGSPTQPGTSHGARLKAPIDKAGIEGLIAQVEARLQSHPEDGQGWDVIAPVYLRQGRFVDAAQAFQRAIRLLGESPRRLAGLGEATVFAANGVVTEEAKRTFERLLQLDPSRPEPQFWLALAKEQDGDLNAALADYRKLVVGAPADAPWRAAVEERIADLSRQMGTATPSPGPTAEDVAAAAQLKPEERAAMIDQMVAGLAERLKTDSRDLAGWERLLRAYATLGQKDKASEALAEARKAFAEDQTSLSTLNDLARKLGLDT